MSVLSMLPSSGSGLGPKAYTGTSVAVWDCLHPGLTERVPSGSHHVTLARALSASEIPISPWSAAIASFSACVRSVTPA